MAWGVLCEGDKVGLGFDGAVDLRTVMAAQSSRGSGWEGLSQARDRQQTLLGPAVASSSLQEIGTTGACRGYSPFPYSSRPFSLGMAGEGGVCGTLG